MAGSSCSAALSDQPSIITMKDRSLLVDGAPYEIRGISYSPLLSYAERMQSPPDVFHKGYSPRWQHDLPLLAALGVNTLRLYNWNPQLHVDDISFLDACASVGLRVLLPISNYFLDNPGHVKSIVYRVATHPAVLMWAVSNEPAGTSASDSADSVAAFKKAARLTQEVREAERMTGTWHPITVPLTCDMTALTPLEASGALIDVDGFNCYWAADKTFPHDFFPWHDSISSRPILLTEFGIDAFDNNAGVADEATQAQHLSTQWTSLISPAGSQGSSIGGFVFEWMDEPWKAALATTLGAACKPNRGGVFAGWGPNALPDQCANEAFFGVAELLPGDETRLKPSYNALQKLWASTSRQCVVSIGADGGDASGSQELPLATTAGASAVLVLAVLVVIGTVWLKLRRVGPRDDDPAPLRSATEQNDDSCISPRETEQDVEEAAPPRRKKGSVELVSSKSQRKHRQKR